MFRASSHRPVSILLKKSRAGRLGPMAFILVADDRKALSPAVGSCFKYFN